LDEAALALAAPDGFSIEEAALQRAAPGDLPRGVSREEMWRAVLESLALRGRSVLDTIERVSGSSPGLVVTGGVARGRAFQELKRRLVAPFVLAPVSEAGARGAALLGGCAAGLFSDVTAVPAPLGED
jgi:sugar (pentulose or hexulose) kinase